MDKEEYELITSLSNDSELWFSMSEIWYHDSNLVLRHFDTMQKANKALREYESTTNKSYDNFDSEPE